MVCFRVVALFAHVSRLDALEGNLDGLRIHMPQDGADVPNLPAPSTMTLYCAGEFDVCQKFVRQGHYLKQAGRQGDQLLPYLLQGLVFLFFLGSAFNRCIH